MLLGFVEILAWTPCAGKLSPIKTILEQTDFGIQEYFRKLSVSQSRLRFKLHAHMTPRVAACFPSDREFRARGLQCVACRQAGEPVSTAPKDTEEHIMACTHYAKFRQNLILDTDKGIVEFFKRVINERSG